jgi:hypothetical protein
MREPSRPACVGANGVKVALKHTEKSK